MAKCTFSFSKNCEVSKMSWTAKSESSGSICWSTQGHNFCRRLSFLRPAISVHSRHERKLRHPPTHRATTTTTVLEIHIAQIRATIKVAMRHSYWGEELLDFILFQGCQNDWGKCFKIATFIQFSSITVTFLDPQVFRFKMFSSLKIRFPFLKDWELVLFPLY